MTGEPSAPASSANPVPAPAIGVEVPGSSLEGGARASGLAGQGAAAAVGPSGSAAGGAPTMASGGAEAGTDEPGAIVEDPTGGARLCSPPSSPSLLDFEVLGPNPSEALFGDFQSNLSGGTFVYPTRSGSAAGQAEAAPDAGLAVVGSGLSSDVTEGSWHVSGIVAEPSGFGLFLECELLDASRFVGVAFRLQGSVAAGEQLTFFINSAGNQVARSWLLDTAGAAEPSFGRCLPAQSQFDGTCQAARIVVNVSAEGADVFVPFAALTDGSPELGLEPSEITELQWLLPLPPVDEAGNVQPYAVDLRLDDIRFVEPE